MPIPTNLDEIIEFFWVAPDDAEWRPKRDTIPLDHLRQWMKSSDIEILGFAFDMVGDSRFEVEPTLSVNEYLDFAKHYLGRCVRENPDGEWSESRYSAGNTLVRVFVHVWDEESVPRAHLQDLKEWLAAIYKEGDDEIRTCVVQATVEHLFERKAIMDFFSDWRKDPLLHEAYDQAALWPEGGGNTHLTDPYPS